MARVYTRRARPAERVLGPVERGIYRAAAHRPGARAGLERTPGRRWCSARCSARALRDPADPGDPPVQPRGLRSAHLGRDLQHRRRRSSPTPTGSTTAARRRMSYFSQMAGLAVQNFVSAAVGMAVAGRGDPRVRRAGRRAALGNFWVDLTRVAALHPAADLDRRCAAAGLPGRGPDLAPYVTYHPRRRRADARARAGRLAGRHQAARHQRRRVLQRQLGDPVREPHAALELRRDAADPADPGRR